MRKKPLRARGIEVSEGLADEVRKAVKTGRLSTALLAALPTLRASLPQSTMHHQVLIRHGQISAHVDENIAPLILETWRAGIATDISCEDAGPEGLDVEGMPPKTAQIGFPTTSDARRWLAIVSKNKTQTTFPYHTLDESGWTFQVRPYWTEKTTVDMRVIVYLPRRASSACVRRLRTHNRKLSDGTTKAVPSSRVTTSSRR